MEELSLKNTHSQLLSAFQQKYKIYKLFTLILQNQHLLIILSTFLNISDILALGVTCKDYRLIIQGNTSIQNRVLKSQVQYLTKQQERNLQYIKLKKNNIQVNSAYAMFEELWNNYPMSIEQRIQKMQYNKFNLHNNLLFVPWAIKAQQKAKKQQSKSIKNDKIQKQTKKQGHQQKNQIKSIKSNLQHSQLKPKIKPASQSYRQMIQKDQDLKLITKLQQMSIKTTEQQKVNNFYRIEAKKKEYVLKKFMQHAVYTEITAPDQSLIIGKQTFWDRLKNKFRGNYQ